MDITNGTVVVSGNDNPLESSERQSKSPLSLNVNTNAKNPKQDIHKTVPNHDLEIDDDPLIDVSDTEDLVQETSNELHLLQAQVFIEDAAMYRSVDHKVDRRSLVLYRFYHSKLFSLLKIGVITLLHILAFFEFPSSLTWTSDIRTRGERAALPCGVTETIEILCLVFLVCDVILKYRIYGAYYLKVNRWLLVELVVLVISFIDWSVSVGIGCGEVVRVRRMLRPIFIIQNSSLMKKILNSLRKTVPQILGVLLLMGLHLYIFTLFGMLLFPKPNKDYTHPVNTTSTTGDTEAAYFRTLIDSFIVLLVLLTTANNPDVMMPAYSKNRLTAIFFIVFVIIGLYCFMNMLTAIIYNQFRGYFLRSMQSSLMRCRMGQRAAFEALKQKSVTLQSIQSSVSESEQQRSEKVLVRDLKLVITNAKLGQDMKVLLMETIAAGFNPEQLLTWNNFLSVLRMMEMDKNKKEKPEINWIQGRPWLLRIQKIVCHRYFSYFGNFIALVNVILISFELATEYDRALTSSKSALRIINFLFIIYYVIEQSLMVVCLGFRRYLYDWTNIYDGIIVTILLISEIVTVSIYGFPFFSESEAHDNTILWNTVRLINILIMFRVLRVIWHIKAMAIVAHTLLDLVKNLRSFGGILVVIYYFFAMLGMELFQGKITYAPVNNTGGNSSILSNPTMECGSYEQLNYWANNFDDFAASIVVLWDIMVLNNWQVFMYAYGKYTTKWSYLYFIVWWLSCVILILNLFTALILENFIMKWDRFYDATHQRRSRQDTSRQSVNNNFHMNTLTVHDIFRPNLKEPSEAEIMETLSRLRFFPCEQNLSV
ncbi:two pore channel protein 2-like isoform X2 [Dreissena polymorpha]|uniref:two pore channel protein 2-like isoform X2 n=1 Tax=Dreissena polymorpha TaxID=45954 RepID=UPI00226416AF|nr:two pore channel protein 2-like isoform X2 [Dreissena polymorpha]